MGKSGGKKKKASSASGEGVTKLDPDAAVFLRRAHELKDEGNRRFQAKDYAVALETYEQALKLTPEGHPDRAVFHSNRAACLLQVKPVIYENVVLECTLALEAHPKFGKALFRRARAYEAMGKLQLALADVQLLLQSESNNQDALELGKRLRVALGNNEEAQQDLQWRSSVSSSASPPDSGTSPATPGADSAPSQSGRGPTLPARPVGKKKGRSTIDSEATLRSSGESGSSVPIVVPNTSPTESAKSSGLHVKSHSSGTLHERKVTRKTVLPERGAKSTRPLKLVFGHDIRRAEIRENCGFGELCELVKKRFPSLKAVLIKYHDSEGDLVTITSREELRLAEAAADEIGRSKRQMVVDIPTAEKLQEGSGSLEKVAPAQLNTSSVESVRLHIVEVTPEQEPPIPEDDDIVGPFEEDVTETIEEVAAEAVQSLEEKDAILPESEQVDSKLNKVVKKEDTQQAGEEMEIDDWLFDFAQLFRTHVGIDPDGHVDFHELGMELCSEALEVAVTSDEAQPLFEAAAAKFQEVAALALFNWGNVYMCAARKRMPIEEAGGKPESKEQLQAAYEWAQGHYKLAGQKYEEALKIKPDFYEGVLALGQEKFESAKLQWAAAVAGGVDLKTWDSSETLSLYSFAEERMQTAAEMWEQLEAQQQGAHAEAISKARKEQLKSDSSSPEEGVAMTEAADQGAAMRSQINLFWGNVLFEHSQVEYRLGLLSWKSLLDLAVEKFVSAGASAEEIEGALKNHPANLEKEKANGSSSSTISSMPGVDSNGNILDPAEDSSSQATVKKSKSSKNKQHEERAETEKSTRDADGKVGGGVEVQGVKEERSQAVTSDGEANEGKDIVEGTPMIVESNEDVVGRETVSASMKSNKVVSGSGGSSGSGQGGVKDNVRTRRTEVKRSQGS